LSRFRPIAAGGFDRARRLRRDATEAEKALWLRLRNRGFEGLKFRRQVPFGRYALDLFCEELQLVIELDGGQHADLERDVVRTRYLGSQGLRVLRFWNNDVLSNMEGVLESLKLFIANHPSPSGEGGARAR
jgi:very-short-patch-repair endonuclease